MAETRIADEVVIEAPVSIVWAAIKNPAAHAGWHPFVTAIEGEHVLGAARSCSVIVGRRTGVTQELCIEEAEGRRLLWLIEHDTTGFSRMVSEWRAGFTLEPADTGTRVIAESLFHAKTVVVRLMGPIVRRKFHQTQKAILAALKTACEDDVRGRERVAGGSPSPFAT
jgi:uncharacterized protein YndB with AHSA1/START domain